MQTKRIEYIDAMRGFTMLLVVYSHVVSHSLYITGYTFNSFLLEFRMPLFFFISGWVMFKPTRTWDSRETTEFLWKKFLVQIIPTAFFLFVYLITLRLDFSPQRFGAIKSGYWFTFALFEYFVFYVFTIHLVPKRFRYSKIEDVILIFIALCIGGIAIMSRKNAIESPLINEYLGAWQWKYYVFFCFGTLVKKYFNTFLRLTDNKHIMALVIMGMILLAITYQRMELGSATRMIACTILATLCIIVVFTFFRKKERYITKDKPIGRGIQYIGRRTLDIYLLHHIFLPRNMQMVGEFLSQHNNPTLELFLSMTIAFMVTAICLFVSEVIRLSPFLGKYLFGAKEKRTEA